VQYNILIFVENVQPQCLATPSLIQTALVPCGVTKILTQCDHSPGKIREFQSGQGKVRENGKSQGK